MISQVRARNLELGEIGAKARIAAACDVAWFVRQLTNIKKDTSAAFTAQPLLHIAQLSSSTAHDTKP